MTRLRLILFTLIPLLLGCDKKPTELTLYYSVHEPMGMTALKIHDILESKLNVKVKTVIGSGSIEDLEKVKSTEGHLALVENHLGFQEGIKALMPLYPQILHVFYKGEETSDFKNVLFGKNVFLGYEGDGSYSFAMQLLEYFNIEASSFNRTEDPFTADVLFGFTDIISNDNLKSISKYRIFSFDKVDRTGLGSMTEGIALKYPRVKPFIIPKGTYNLLSQDPVMTLASDVLLVASDQMSDELAYEISKEVFLNIQEFNEISPLISLDLKEDFDRSLLSFPLHNGARVYLDRDEPTFAERYAELFGLVLSLMIAVSSGLYSFLSWVKQKKKDRIDVFYAEIMLVKARIREMTERKEVVSHIRLLQRDQQKAFQMLVDEKLLANESFRIYMELSKEAVNELKAKYKRLES